MPERLSNGTVIDDRFEIVAPLGEGGTATVYKAKQLELKRFVAMKFLHSSLLGDQEWRTRFKQEVRLLSELRHPNLLGVYSYGIWQSQFPYIVMEFVEGCTLHSIIHAQEQHWSNVVSTMSQMCDAVSYLHSNGIVHRDLKPANIMISRSAEGEIVKVVDLGLARILPHNGSSMQGLTQTGVLIGSYHYMSPEQSMGHKADERSDIYALGCILYECLTAEPPFSADNPIAVLHKHIHEPISNIWKRAKQPLPEKLEEIIFKCLSKDPAERYQRVADLKDDLKTIRLVDALPASSPKSSSFLAKRKLIWLGALSVLSLLMLSAVVPEVRLEQQRRLPLEILSNAEQLMAEKRYGEAISVLKKMRLSSRGDWFVCSKTSTLLALCSWEEKLKNNCCKYAKEALLSLPIEKPPTVPAAQKLVAAMFAQNVDLLRRSGSKWFPCVEDALVQLRRDRPEMIDVELDMKVAHAGWLINCYPKVSKALFEKQIVLLQPIDSRLLAHAYAERAMVLFRRQDYDTADKLLEKSLSFLHGSQLAQDKAVIYLGTATSCLEPGRRKRLLELGLGEIDRSMVHPCDKQVMARLLYSACACSLVLENYTQSEQLLQRAMQLYYEPTSIIDVCELMRRAGKHETPLPVLRMIIEQYPDSNFSTDALAQQARCYVALGRFAEAEECWQKNLKTMRLQDRFNVIRKNQPDKSPCYAGLLECIGRTRPFNKQRFSAKLNEALSNASDSLLLKSSAIRALVYAGSYDDADSLLAGELGSGIGNELSEARAYVYASIGEFERASLFLDANHMPDPISVLLKRKQGSFSSIQTTPSGVALGEKYHNTYTDNLLHTVRLMRIYNAVISGQSSDVIKFSTSLTSAANRPNILLLIAARIAASHGRDAVAEEIEIAAFQNLLEFLGKDHPAIAKCLERKKNTGRYF